MAGSFAAGMAAPVAASAWAFQTNPAFERDWKFHGAPMTEPS